jgi:hypothetical protein
MDRSLFYPTVMFSALAAASALLFAFVLPQKGTPSPTQSRDTSLRLTLELSKPQCIEGEAVDMEARLMNAGPSPVAVLLPGAASDLAVSSANLRVVVVSSFDQVTFRTQAQSQAIVSLFPGAYWGCRVDLRDVVGQLAADTYTLRLAYELSQDHASKFAPSSRAKIWVGRAQSAEVKLKIQSTDEAKLIQTYRQQWQGANSDEGKLRALMWLKANVLQIGMTDAQVIELLGEPATRTAGSGSAWQFRVGRTGIMLSLENGLVTQISPFET